MELILKRISEQIDVPVDFSSEGRGAAVTAASVTAETGINASVSLINSSTVVLRISGGTADLSYRVSVYATLADGQVRARAYLISIENASTETPISQEVYSPIQLLRIVELLDDL